MGRGSCVLISPGLMAWIVYSNERSTGEARRATLLSSYSPTSFTAPFLLCISTSYSSLAIIVAVTGPCIFVFLSPKPSEPRRFPDKEKHWNSNCTFPTNLRLRYPACAAPSPSTSSSSIHYARTSSIHHTHHLLRLLLAASQYTSHPCLHRARTILAFVILLSASGQPCRRVRLISTRRFRRRAA